MKLDRELWESIEAESARLSDCFKVHPEKKDSLVTLYQQLQEMSNQKNRDLAVKFASVPSGLQRLFWLRLSFPKDTLLSILNSLPLEMKQSAYGKSLLQHINSTQIEEGSKYYDFEAMDAEGQPFKLSSLEGKNVLLLYGGLSCMGEDGRNYLKQLDDETANEKFQIVVYSPCSGLEDLKGLKANYPGDYILVSDFLEDQSMMKIIYGAQARPTCFLIDKQGTVLIKSIGLPEEQLTELKSQKKLE